MTKNRAPRYYLNKIHLLFEMIMRRPSPTNVPVYCLHEPTTGCNLKCPACPTGAGVTDLKETATLEDYEQVIKEFGAYLDVYYLFNWGEPTMHRELTAILDRLRTEPFRVHMSSNFSVPLKDETIAALANMPNLNLRINVDGATQESHQKYRVNSKLSTVLDNAERLSREITLGLHHPEVYFGFLSFDYNKDEFDAVQAMAQKLKFPAIRFDNPLVADETIPEVGLSIEQEIGCTWLYSSISPSPGLTKIAPCCGVWDEKQMSDRAGSLHETFMREPKYMSRRTYDAEFAKRPNIDRVEHLRSNLRADKGMALRQREYTTDVCVNCTMGKSYQNKLPGLTAAAIGAYAALTRTDAQTAQTRLFRILGLVTHENTGLRDAVCAALDMPPAATRTDEDYRPFMRLLASS